MTQNIKNGNNLKNLYELYSGFLKYEELLKNKSNENNNEGFLIEKDAIEKLKENIFYDNLKPYLTSQNNTYNYFINNKHIKRFLDKYREIKIYINHVEFKNGEELIISLNDDKKYYLISKPLWIKISKSHNINIYDIGIPFSFEKNNIILYLNIYEKLYFKVNDGIIEKSSFIENKSIYKKSERIKENNEEDDNTVNENIVLSNQNFNYKKEIEILIRLYFFHKELKEKNNSSSYLFYYNKETFYLINKLWIEKFENFYEYKELELILKQINKSSTLFQDKNYICDSLIEEIISKLPINYINKFMKKNKNEFDNKPIKYDYNKINDNRIEIKYLINNQIINYKIYELLNSFGYCISNLIKTDLYFIENNKLVLLFQFPSKETIEIGYINKENIIIPEFIIYNKEKDISIRNLNNFFSNYYSKFKSNQNENLIQFNDNNTNIYCYKLNNSMEINGNQENKILDMENYRNIEDNNDGSVIQQLMKYNNYEINESKKKEIELFDKIKKRIKISLLLYLFEKDIEKKLKNSINSMNGEEYKQFIVEDTGYLINFKWINNFKNKYLYDKIIEYFNNINSLERINVYEDKKIDDIFFSHKDEFLKNFNNDDLKKNEFNSLPKLLNLKLYKNISYCKNFYLINSDTYESLKKNLILNDKFDIYVKKIKYIINNGKLIFKNEFNNCYSIFIYKQIDNYAFIPEIFIYFHSNKNEMNSQYENFKINKNIKYDINNTGNNNNFIQVDSFYLYDTQSKEEVSKIKTGNQINKKPIEFLLNIYLIRKDIENKIKRTLINTSIEKYTIIKKELMNKILNYFEYNNFVDFIKENVLGKNEEKILDEIMNKFYNNEYLMNLNNKIKIVKEALKNIKKLNENDIDYNKDDIEIINDKVKNFINELIGDINIVDRKFLFGDQKIIMDYKFVKNYFIIGNFENSTFKPEIMLNFEQNKYTENYFSIFQNKGYNSFINELKLNNNFIITSEKQKIKEIKIKENYQFSSNENDYNEGNSNIKFIHNINKDIQHSNILSSNNNQNVINDGNLKFHDQILSDKRNVLITQNNKQRKDIEESIIREANKGEVNDDMYIFKELKNILSIMIDIEKIKLIMKMPLNSGNSDEYYLLNYEWFKKYLELNSINDEIYGHLVELVKKNYININNINEVLITKIISQIKPNIKMKIKNMKEKENYNKLKNNELFNLNFSSFIIKGNKKLKYYYNFIIISDETKKILNKDFSFDYRQNLILLGDNKVFIKRNTQCVIEICSINNKNIFIPELFFYFFDENILKNNLNLLQSDGYEQYNQYNLLFNNDYVSPIFDKNNNSIGYAFKYEPSIKDYSIYQINEQLKAIIQLYFNKAQLKYKLNSKELMKGNYLLFDIKYMKKIKELFDYNNLEKELNNNVIAKQIMYLFEKNNSKIGHNILEEKKISLIIKYLPDEINKNYNKREFNNKIECQEIPNLIPFNNGNLFYYNNFEIVEKSIYDLLFKLNNKSLLSEEKNNYLQCIFIEKYILINISNINSKYILEVCIINDNNNINPLYILEYDNGDNFLKHINYVKTIFGVENFFESLDFTINNKIQMNDENDKEIGIIYNLGINNNTNILSLSNNDPKALNQIYILCKEYYNYEKFMNNGAKNNDCEGYLIDENKIENLKNKIHYDKLKNDIDNSFENIKDKITNLGENKEIERNITQTKFNNSEDLIESLKNNKKYYLINKSLWINICRFENKEERGVIFSFSGKNILLSLNENDKKILHFKINGGIIEKSSIVINRNQYLFLKNYKINENIKKNLLKENIDNISFDSMCCLNCKSQIEIKLIKFNGYNKEDSITIY